MTSDLSLTANFGSPVVFSSFFDPSDPTKCTNATDIWMAAPDGNLMTRLTSVPTTLSDGAVYRPVLSGSRTAAFMADHDPITGAPIAGTQVWLSSVNSSLPTRLWNNTEADSSLPKWFADTLRLGFLSDHVPDANTDGVGVATNLWIADTRTSTPHPLTTFTSATIPSPFYDGSYDLSPDNKAFVFEANADPSQPGFDNYVTTESLFVINTDGSGLRLLATAADDVTSFTSPSWSADGQYIAFSEDGANLWVAQSDGSVMAKITETTAVTYGAPFFSPVSNDILFASTQDLSGADSGSGFFPTNVWSIKPDGSGLHPLTNFVNAVSQYPWWSADGTGFYFESNRALDGSDQSLDTLGGMNIWFQPTSGAAAMPVTNSINCRSIGAYDY